MSLPKQQNHQNRNNCHIQHNRNFGPAIRRFEKRAGGRAVRMVSKQQSTKRQEKSMDHGKRAKRKWW
eukprot:15238891-Ditylum_brightwellii.AAC.1